MNFLGLPGFVGGGAARSGAPTNGPPDSSATDANGARDSANGGDVRAGASSGGDSDRANDTSATQSIAAPQAAVQTAEARTTSTADAILADIPAPTADQRAFAEQTATRLFYESLIADIASTPNAPDLASVNPDDRVSEAKQTQADANTATERFKEGLKLVNETA